MNTEHLLDIILNTLHKTSRYDTGYVLNINEVTAQTFIVRKW